jgi:hypothetical protein
MKIDDKIRSRKMVYLLRRAPRDAYRLALLYFILAKRKSSAKKIIEACLKAKRWLKRAGLHLPAEFQGINPYILLREVENGLVLNKSVVGARLSA